MTAADDQVVLITRILDAPRDRVFAAWTDPEQIAAWFGPAQMEVPPASVRVDLRVGGRYELTMVAPGGGAEHPVSYEIVELDEPALIVLRSDPMPEMGMPEGTVTRVEFHDHGDRTRMTLSDGPYPPGAGGAEGGWNGAFGKLEALLSSR